MKFLFIYLAASVLLYIMEFCEGISMRSYQYEHLVSYNRDHFSVRQYFRDLFVNGWVVFRHLFFKVHCPWSWGTARQYRVSQLRSELRGHCTHHEVLGHMNDADFDDPSNHEAIAKYCFVPRWQYWGTEFFGMLVRIPILCFAVVALVLLGTLYELRELWRALRRRFKKKRSETVRNVFGFRDPDVIYQELLRGQRADAPALITRERYLSDNRVH